MPNVTNTSSLPANPERLRRISLDRLRPHPFNANLMSKERHEKLKHNVAHQGGHYPPLIVPSVRAQPDHYELLDGHNRAKVLRELGHVEALCYVWDCDDATALTLLATLNRLEGEDVPAKRAELLAELTRLVPNDLALFLPEDAAQLEVTLALLDLDVDRLLADLAKAEQHRHAAAPRLLSFAVLPEDEAIIERAIAAAITPLDGKNKRGRALAIVARAYVDGGLSA